MMDEGLVSANFVAEACLGYMSEDDVADMMRCNDILDEEDDEEESDPMDDVNYVGHPIHY
jgi:hypothetical protein